MRTRRTLLFLLLATTATVSLTALIHIAVTPTADAEGDEKPEARLLLKCPASEVVDVLKALQGREVQLWDLDTMKRVYTPVSADKIPGLPDAHKLMLELLTTLEALKTKDGQPLVRVTEMAIQPRRAMVKITTADGRHFDSARKALAGNAYVKARGAMGPDSGAMQSLPDGRFRQSFSFRLKDEAPPGAPKRPAVQTISMMDIETAVLSSNMKMIYASAVSEDPHPSRGHRTISREFTFAAATLTQLKALVHNLSQGPAGLTVYELRWKLAPDKLQSGHPFDRIQKPVIRVGGRASLSR